MRVLLVTDDVRYADRVAAAAALLGVPVIVSPTDENVDATAARAAPNVVVFDAEDAFSHMARVASAFAAIHPQMAVAIVASRATERRARSLLVFDRWRSAERLLGELERAYVGLRVAREDHLLGGE
jgi:DNA-binding NarL/FixJ family response regulator